MSNAETTLLRDGFPFKFLSLTPFETPDLRLAAALLRSQNSLSNRLGPQWRVVARGIRRAAKSGADGPALQNPLGSSHSGRCGA